MLAFLFLLRLPLLTFLVLRPIHFLRRALFPPPRYSAQIAYIAYSSSIPFCLFRLF